MRMRPLPFLATALLLAPAFSACSSDAPGTKTSALEAGVVPACGSNVDPTCPNPAPSYKTHVVPILDAKCNNCHDGADGGPWPLTSHDDILHWRSLILGDMLHCSMPPADAGLTLSADERAVLIGWLACKAPDN